jgi:hypothetical protein
MSLVVDSEEVGPDSTAETYAALVTARLRALPGCSPLESEDVDLHGVPASISSFTWEPTPGGVLRHVQLSWVENGRGWSASATTRAQDGAGQDEQLRRLVELAAAQALNGAPPTEDLWQTPREAWNEVRRWF